MLFCVFQDYEFLCPDGTRAPLGRYESCNLGKVPSHAVVVSVRANTSTIDSIVRLLLVAQVTVYKVLFLFLVP